MTNAFETGMLRDIVTAALATSGGPGAYQTGFVRDSTGALVVVAGTGTWQTGFLRDSSNNVVTIDKAAVTGAVWQTGFLRGPTGALVTVGRRAATSSARTAWVSRSGTITPPLPTLPQRAARCQKSMCRRTSTRA